MGRPRFDFHTVYGVHRYHHGDGERVVENGEGHHHRGHALPAEPGEEPLVGEHRQHGLEPVVEVEAAEQAKILYAEAEENNLDYKALDERWTRWYTCSLCRHQYHGVVACALGWACWKTYVGRPETDPIRLSAIGMLGSGLTDARHDEDALSVREAQLSLMRRLGASERDMLATQTNLACSYQDVGRHEEALRLRRDVYSGILRYEGEESSKTLIEANNYAVSLNHHRRFEEAKALLRKTIPVARRVFGESNELTLRMRSIYAESLFRDPSATLDDLREAVTTLEETTQTARRVLGGAHPTTEGIGVCLRDAQAALRALWCPRIAVFEEFCDLGGEDESN